MNQMQPEDKYAVFISYRHKYPDKVIAKVLQFLLEYNLVRPNKQVPRHIRKVFLDTSELPTSEDLEADILRALDNSDCLFVICSPDLPESKYCMKEISYFKEKHGGSLDRIATLLVRGEPQESYPALLRTKCSPDPRDPSRVIETEVEPLYADVRARTLIGSLWKLFTSEYLRLACRYYRCAYDALKKRHKRNLFLFLTLALVTIAGVTGVLTWKERQIQQTVADSYASYANEQTRAGNELLALALCTHTDCRDTEAYNAALRSAVVQLDYKQKNQPVAKQMETQYFHGAFTNYFLSATENKLVVADGNVWQIIDAHNGAVLSQIPYESAFVLGSKPDTYVLLRSHPDEAGIFRDYVVLMNLETDQVITEFPFREASTETPDYDVITDVETGYLHCLTDHGEFVAYFTSEGRSLTKGEFVALGLEALNAPSDESGEPYLLVRDKWKGTTVVKDRAGTVLLDLPENYQAADFSDDHSLLACAADGILTVCNTRDWAAEAAVSLAPLTVQSLHLLSGSHYCIVSYRDGTTTLSYVCDWRTGETLLTTDATILMASGEKAFYTVQDGTICRYQYTELDNGNRSQVIAHSGERCLSGSSGSYLLKDTAADQVLLQSDGQAVYADEALQNFLLQNSQDISCCDSSGTVKWELACQSVCAAMAPDGSRIAWMDGAGNIQVHRASDGEALYVISTAELAAAGRVYSLVCSDNGIGVFGAEGALWVPSDGGKVTVLGNFTAGTLFSDGLLVMESRARVNEFLLFDTEKGCSLPPAADNTGKWVYGPKTGYLVRHVESSGNNPSLYLEVWKRKGTELSFCGKLDLPANQVEELYMDSIGQHLSVASNGRSRVFRLEDLANLLDAAGQIYYESDALYGFTLYGQYQYRMPMYDTDSLRQWAGEALTSPVGRRGLTEEEMQQYSAAW